MDGREILFTATLFILVCFAIGSIFLLSTPPDDPSISLLATSTSPNRQHTLIAYQKNPGATVDYSVLVYLQQNDRDRLIYNAYHESEVKITWICNDIVSINGKKLDISTNETYDWRYGTRRLPFSY